MSTRRTARSGAAGALVIGLLLAGCADDDAVSSGAAPAGERDAAPTSTAAATPADEEQPGHEVAVEPLRGEDLDRAFLAGMIPHHRAAVEMAQVVIEEGDRPEVQEIARAIIEAQESEIDLMTSIAEEEGYSLSSNPEHSGPMGVLMGVPISMDMSTMADEVAEAEDADAMFLSMMIPHHASAAVMADEEAKYGASEELRELADSIIADQAREIGQMQALRSGSPEHGK